MIKWFKKNIWNDPVWSKVIANGIIFIVAYYFYKFTTLPKDKAPIKAPDNSVDIFIQKSIDFFQTDTGRYISYAILGLLGVIFLWNFYKILRSAVTKYKFNNYCKDNFWGANFKWSWTKYGNNFEIAYNDIQMICPTCSHDLTFFKTDYTMTLKCTNNNCRFESEAFFISSSPSDYTAFILPNQEPRVFYGRFKSKINAGLRQRNLL